MKSRMPSPIRIPWPTISSVDWSWNVVSRSASLSPPVDGCSGSETAMTRAPRIAQMPGRAASSAPERRAAPACSAASSRGSRPPTSGTVSWPRCRLSPGSRGRSPSTEPPDTPAGSSRPSSRTQGRTWCSRAATAASSTFSPPSSRARSRVREATLDDPASLRALLADCAVVVDCAGPFVRYGEPVLAAAVETANALPGHDRRAALHEAGLRALRAGRLRGGGRGDPRDGLRLRPGRHDRLAHGRWHGRARRALDALLLAGIHPEPGNRPHHPRDHQRARRGMAGRELGGGGRPGLEAAPTSSRRRSAAGA